MSDEIQVDLEKLVGQLYIQVQGQAQYITALQARIAKLESNPLSAAQSIVDEARGVINGPR